jgi:hypothetical protein
VLITVIAGYHYKIDRPTNRRINMYFCHVCKDMQAKNDWLHDDDGACFCFLPICPSIKIARKEGGEANGSGGGGGRNNKKGKVLYHLQQQQWMVVCKLCLPASSAKKLQGAQRQKR